LALTALAPPAAPLAAVLAPLAPTVGALPAQAASDSINGSSMMAQRGLGFMVFILSQLLHRSERLRAEVAFRQLSAPAGIFVAQWQLWYARPCANRVDAVVGSQTAQSA
jgi:hypothetical protein